MVSKDKDTSIMNDRGLEQAQRLIEQARQARSQTCAQEFERFLMDLLSRHKCKLQIIEERNLISGQNNVRIAFAPEE